MLSQSRINAPFERAAFPHHFPLTPSAGAVINLPLTRPGSLSLPEEACDYCDSRAVEEVVSYSGDEEHIQFLCSQCWLAGFSPEVEEVAA